MSWRAGCRIAGPAPAVSQAPSTVSWPCRCAHAPAAACRVAAMSLPYRQACRDTPQQPSLRLSRYNQLYRDTLPSGQASLSCHNTILCIATLTPSHARAAGRVVASLGRVAALPWSCHGRGWPCRGPCYYAQDCCVTIQLLVS